MTWIYIGLVLGAVSVLIFVASNKRRLNDKYDKIMEDKLRETI